MFCAMKASGLARNSDTSIWSSETPGRSVRPAMPDSVSPRRTSTSSVLVAACAGSDGRVAAGAAARGAGAGASARGAVGAGATGAAARGAAGSGRAAAGAGPGAGETCADVAGAAGWARVTGGSNNIVYSRTSRPEDQLSSRIMSINGSWTGRSLVTLSTWRPSARFCSETWVPGSTAL